MKRSIVTAAALLLVFFASTMPGMSKTRLIPEGRWTIYHVTDLSQGVWSAWYSLPPWPVKYRFMCSKGTLVINASNTSELQERQGVPIRAWYAETDEAALDRAIDNGRAEQNAGVALPAGQSTMLYEYRPSLCSAATQSVVFGAVYGR